MLIRGSCHCGNISLAFTLDPEPFEIAARACGCSFCSKHGGVWTSSADGSIKVTVKNPSLVCEYAFGTRTARFHVCSTCGIVPVVTSRIDDRLYAVVVNVNALEGLDPSLLRRASATFDGESEEARLQRRKRNWVANVEFVEGGIEPAPQGRRPAVG